MSAEQEAEQALRSEKKDDGRAVLQDRACERQLSVRPMSRADVEAADAIDREAFPQSLWGKATFLQNLANCYDLVLVCTDEAQAEGIHGFAILRILGEEAELLLIAAAKECRSRGIGTALLTRLIELSRVRGAKQIFLEVRAGNTPAIRLYHKLGFREIGLRRRYYHAPEEDALLMRKDMTEKKE